MAETVAQPIEQQVNGVEKMLYMSSQCTNDGGYNLTVTFKLGTDLDLAQVLVQNRVSLAVPSLPDVVKATGVSTKKKSPAILLVVNVLSDDDPKTGKPLYNQLYLSNYASIQIKDELARIDGVGDVTLLGQQDYSMRVWLDPDKLASRSSHGGRCRERTQRAKHSGSCRAARPAPGADWAGFPVHADHARPTDRGGAVRRNHHQDRKGGRNHAAARGWPDGARCQERRHTVHARRQAIGWDGDLSVAGFERTSHRRPNPGSHGATERAISRRSRSSIVYDTTPFIDESVHEVFKSLRDAVHPRGLVVLFFLQDWKAMILPMIDVPVSLIGTFAIMHLFGFTLNNLTLFGLVLAIGIVVDDAIVVLENVERWMAKGFDAKTATINAMSEITGPIIAITLVLCSVFLPSAFIPGVTGQFYRQFALTISVAMIISAINAMTMTPSRAVVIFSGQKLGEHGHEGAKPCRGGASPVCSVG